MGQQQQLKLLNSGECLEIRLVQLNILLQTVHIQEETRAVRMRGVKMMGLKVLSTWQGKSLLLKVDLEVTGIDIGRVNFVLICLLDIIQLSFGENIPLIMDCSAKLTLQL